MFGNAFSGWHLVIILVIVLLLFGAPKLPGLAKSVGQSMRIFKSEVKSMNAEGEARSEVPPETAERVPAAPGSPAARSHDA